MIKGKGQARNELLALHSEAGTLSDVATIIVLGYKCSSNATGNKDKLIRQEGSLLQTSVFVSPGFVGGVSDSID